MWMRPAPVLSVNSTGSTPIVCSAHSKLSRPVEMAMCGRCPSLWFFGRRVRSAPTAVSVQADTSGMTTPSRRHLPICTTRGTFAPAGTPLRVKVPSAAESVAATGAPDGGLLHGSHEGPLGMASSGPLGT